MNQATIPIIKVRGGPATRGRQYGAQAAASIKASLAAYQVIFRHYLHQDWDAVRKESTQFVPAIRNYRPHLLEELAGIAEGAGVTFEDILALNLRTEFINRATALRSRKECTAIVTLPSITEQKHTLLGQNWDWRPLTANTLIILVAEPDDGIPGFVTLVEAGMLAKTGMNAAGLGLVTNALVTDQDGKQVGVPYHIILRGILEADSISSAEAAIPDENRAAAGNYLIAQDDGQTVNLETSPGGKAGKIRSRDQHGMIVHTNHFIGGDTPAFKDLGLLDGDDSLQRYQRVLTLFASLDRPADLQFFKRVLSDHEHYPLGICCHTIKNMAPAEQYASLASVVMDLNTATIWVAGGNPCQTDFVEYCYQEIFSRTLPS